MKLFVFPLLPTQGKERERKKPEHLHFFPDEQHCVEYFLDYSSLILSLSFIFAFVHNSISTTFSGLNECYNDHSPREMKKGGKNVLPIWKFFLHCLLDHHHFSFVEEREKKKKQNLHGDNDEFSSILFFSHFPLDLIGLTSVVTTELFSKLSKAHQNYFSFGTWLFSYLLFEKRKEKQKGFSPRINSPIWLSNKDIFRNFN